MFMPWTCWSARLKTLRSIKKPIGFEHIIETALGMQNIESIAAASKRNESLHFGVADYAASTKARTTAIGGVNEKYSVLTDGDTERAREIHWGDMWHYALSRLVVAARANGLRPIDGPFGDFSDDDGFLAAANRAATLGFEGKWAIHPSQINLANAVMTPSKKISLRLSPFSRLWTRQNKLAVSLNGKLVDLASIRQAEVLVEKGKQIGII